MSVCVIREGLSTMLTDCFYGSMAGSGIMMYQPIFVPAGVRTEATRPEFSGGDRLSALRAYGLCWYRCGIGDGIPVAIGFDRRLREIKGTGYFRVFHARLTVLINQVLLLFRHGIAPI